MYLKNDDTSKDPKFLKIDVDKDGEECTNEGPAVVL
jgi:hypothetical protein